MALWQFLIVIGIGFLILEMFTPMMFFLSLAIAAFASAGLSLFTQNLNYIVPFFTILSISLLFLLRPLLMRNKKSKNNQTGVSEKYIGKIAKATSTISQKSGTLSIYDERWEARCEGLDIIAAGSEVKIIKNDGLIFFVEKV